MQFPPKIAIPICIEQGAVYLYCLDTVNKDGSKYNGDRFFIVLSMDPKNDEIIYLVTITKQIENLKKYVKNIKEDSNTIVEISPSDFAPLKCLSAINCNQIYEKTLSELIASVESGGKIFIEKLSKIIIDKIVSGVLNSNQVSPDVKKKII